MNTLGIFIAQTHRANPTIKVWVQLARSFKIDFFCCCKLDQIPQLHIVYDVNKGFSALTFVTYVTHLDYLMLTEWCYVV